MLTTCKLLTSGLAAAFLASGCVHTRRIAPRATPGAIERVNAEAQDREVRILLRNVRVTAGAPGAPAVPIAGGGDFVARGSRLQLDLERASWDDDRGVRRSAPLEAVRELSHQSPGHPRVTKALMGGGIGAAAGATVGVIIGAAAGDDQCDRRDWCFYRATAGLKAFVGGVFLGGLGLVVGAIAGAVAGDTTVVEIDLREPPGRDVPGP